MEATEINSIFLLCFNSITQTRSIKWKNEIGENHRIEGIWSI